MLEVPRKLGFSLISEERLPLSQLSSTSHPLGRLLHYWRSKCADRAMPRRSDIDPTEFRSNLGRVHLLAVEGADRFCYRVYGSNVTNPDAADMTGKTTRDYKDKSFADLVTRHLAQCVAERQPICMRVNGTMGDEPYVYERISLPLSQDAATVTELLVGTHRVRIPDKVLRWSSPGKTTR